MKFFNVYFVCVNCFYIKTCIIAQLRRIMRKWAASVLVGIMLFGIHNIKSIGLQYAIRNYPQE